MTIGFGFLFVESASGAASLMTSAMRLLSGDHSYSLIPVLSSVTRFASPPRRSINQSCDPFPPCRDERKARKRPSGLKRGAVSASGDDVTCTVSAPSQLVIQMSVSLLSFAESVALTV